MKILIIRLSSIGDIVLTSPVVRCLKQQVNDAEIHYLTKPANVSIMESNPYVDKVIPYSGDGKAMVKTLQQEHYDYVVDLHRNHRSRYIRWNLHVPYSVYNKENFNKIIYIATKWNVMSGRHVVDRYFGAVTKLHVTNDGKGLDYFFPDEPLPEKMPHSPYTVIAVGANHITKAIPLEKIAYLSQKINSAVILLGGKGDKERLAASGIALPENVVNLCGETTLGQSAAIIKDASVVVAPDTGMMHIAAAFHKRIVMVWGCTAAPLGFVPYMTESYDFAIDLPCRPCTRMGRKKCPKGHMKCLADHDWDKISQTINRLNKNNPTE